MAHLGSYPTDCHESLGLESLLKSVMKVQVWLKLQSEEKNNVNDHVHL